MNLKLEAISIPVSDVDLAKAFYEKLGFRLDADFQITDDYRIVQMTPPESDTSIHFGTGVSTSRPGSATGLLLVTDDIEAARADLVERGALVSDFFHGPTSLFAEAGEVGREPGVHPEHASYGSYVAFDDPDGNAWIVQEIGERLPGRLWPAEKTVDTASVLLHLLSITANAHGAYEAAELGGVFDSQWPEWYAAHLTKLLDENGYALVSVKA